jgi:putative tricarboxylic transport membrane protein
MRIFIDAEGGKTEGNPASRHLVPALNQESKMKGIKSHQQMASLFWLAVGIYVAIGAYRLGLGHLHRPGSGFIFFWVSLLVVILALIDLAACLADKSKKFGKSKSLWSETHWPRVILIFSGLLAYVYIFNTLGFLLSTFLLLIFLFKGIEHVKWWPSILGSFIAILVTFAVFQLWLKVPFPAGILGIQF